MKRKVIRQKKGGYDIIVIDDYLSEPNFKNVNSHINDFSYPCWKLSKRLVLDAKHENQFQLMFRMVENKTELFSDSGYLSSIVMDPYVKQLRYDGYRGLNVSVLRARANCFIRYRSFPLSLFGRGMGYHEDMDDENIFTLLLYLADSNGGTQFKDNGRKIKSKRNRAIIFPARVEHQTVMQTNTLFRMNININFAVLPNGMEMVAV